MTVSNGPTSPSSGLILDKTSPVTMAAADKGSPEKMQVESKNDNCHDTDNINDDDDSLENDTTGLTVTAYSQLKKKKRRTFGNGNDDDAPMKTTTSHGYDDVSAIDDIPFSVMTAADKKPVQRSWELDDELDDMKSDDDDTDKRKEESASEEGGVNDDASKGNQETESNANNGFQSDSDGCDAEFDGSKTSPSSKEKLGDSNQRSGFDHDLETAENSDEEAEAEPEETDKNDHNNAINDAANDDDGRQAEEETSKEKAIEEIHSDKVYSIKKGKGQGKATPQQQPDPEDIIVSVDNLFIQADKETVTVKDIVKSLEAEYDVCFTKANKKIVRSHLVDLMSGAAKPCVGEDPGEDEQEPSDSEPEPPSDDEDASIASDASSDYEETTKKARRRPAKKTGKKKSSDKVDMKRKSPRERKSNAAAAAAKIRAHAEKLRKKRMQELRIRNEELQLSQRNEEDQKRAEAIAAKFETNTDEMRYKRLEDRLDLLQKLDQKRIRIIETKDAVCVDDDELVVEQQQSVKVEATDEKPTDDYNKEAKEDGFSDDDDDSSDDDLEIVGAADPKKPLFPSMLPKKPSPLDVLDELDLMSPRSKKKKSNGRQLSPSRNKNARAMLRNTLMQRQRKMGNMWLARELGYKNEEEHLRDCLEVEKKKREIVLKKEAERLAANERTQLRERLKDAERVELLGGEDDEDFELEVGEKSVGDNEEDEEMQLAKALEKEQGETEPNGDDVVVENDETETSNNADGTELGEDSNGLETSVKNQGKSESAADATANTGALPSAEPELSADTQEPDDDEFPLLNDGDDEESQRLETQAPPTLLHHSKPSESAQKDEGDTEDSMNAGSISLTQPELETQTFSAAADPKVVSDATATTDKSLSDENVEKDGDATAEGPKSDSFNDNASQTQIFETQAPPTVSDVAAETDTVATEPASKDSKNDGADIADTDDEGENELEDVNEESEEKKNSSSKPVNKDRNAAWKAMLKSEAEKLKKQKRRNGASGFLETEADEEEEEEVAGLEDFGFSVHKKKDNDDDEEDNGDDELDAEDLKHIVDDVSDDEGDEETGEKRRRQMEEKEEKERHKELMRRMREGYDGRRGGIAGGGVGARGLHRFDQLVAADNREAAKQLGLLNDDEMDSDNEEHEHKDGTDEEEDEAALLDKMLKDRFLHRSSTELEENFSEDEEEEEDNEGEKADEGGDNEEQEQERLAKRFAKRARMQRLIDEYGDEQEFTNSRLIDEDETMMLELKSMKNGLSRKRSSISSSRSSSIGGASTGTSQSDGPTASGNGAKRQKTAGGFGGLLAASGSLSLALKSSRQQTHRTSFLGTSQSSTIGSQDVSSQHKSISFNHVVFQSTDSQLGSRSQLASRVGSSFGATSKASAVRKPRVPTKHSLTSGSLWSKVMHKKRS